MIRRFFADMFAMTAERHREIQLDKHKLALLKAQEALEAARSNVQFHRAVIKTLSKEQ